MMQGVEHDEAISICALEMQARRLLRRHCPSLPSPTLTPRNDSPEVFQQSLSRGRHRDRGTSAKTLTSSPDRVMLRHE